MGSEVVDVPVMSAGVAAPAAGFLATWLLGMSAGIRKDDHHQRQGEPQEHADDLPDPGCREEMTFLDDINIHSPF